MSASEFPATATATQVTVRVKINGQEYSYSSEVTNSEEITFDISEAWRSAYRGIPVTPNTTTTDILKGTVTAQVSYLNQDSLNLSYGAETQLLDNIYALRGGVSEMTIINKGWTKPHEAVTSFKSLLSTRPSTMYVVNVGDNIYRSTYGTTRVTTTITPVTETTESTSQMKVVNEKTRREFLFLNSFGLIESFSCKMLEEDGVDIKSEQHAVQGTPSFVPSNYSRNISKFTKKYEMSSGHLPTDWLEWFTTEFLCSERHWIRIGSKYIPVIITPKNEHQSFIDRTKNELMQVEFEVRRAM